MLLHKESQGDLIEKLTPHCGARSFPVDVKVKIFGNELLKLTNIRKNAVTNAIFIFFKKMFDLSFLHHS